MATKNKAPQKQKATQHEAAQAKAERRRALPAVDFRLQETVQASFTALVPAGTTREEVLRPDYWKHVCKQMPTMSELTILPKDGSWYGKYFVRYAGRLTANIVELQYMELEALTSDDVTNKDFDVTFSTVDRFCVVRTDDQFVMSKGHNTETDAMEWMANHSRSLAA
jgi:hypothetical protein